MLFQNAIRESNQKENQNSFDGVLNKLETKPRSNAVNKQHDMANVAENSSYMHSIKKIDDVVIAEKENEDPSLEIDTSNEISDTGNKRSMSSSDNSDSTPVKKVRNKPQPQIIENMKEYFDNDTLNQLTTTTLRHWLKERSLHCTTREKKENLIEKVRKHFLEM